MITFSKTVATDELLTAYNNQIVEFNSGLSDVTHAIITVSGNDYKIYPDSSGVFWYNFKGLFQRLINTNNFADDNSLSVDYDSVMNNDVYLSLTFTYTVYNETSNETTSQTYKILKDVKQYKDANITVSNLTKLQDDDLTYWVGYPFDISFYSNIDDSVILREVTNSISNYNIDVGVNRLVIDDGDNNIDDVLFAWNDYLELDDGTDTLRFNIEKKDECSGTYIKWFYNGGWYYWLFNEKKKQTKKAKSIGNLFNDFSNQDEAVSPMISRGKTSTKTIRLHATGLSNADRLIIEKIIDSPKVYLFTGEKGVVATINDWLEVEVITSSFIPDNYGKGQYNTAIDIKTNLNTMTL